MRETKEKPRTKPAPGIHHPPTNHNGPLHFAAFGFEPGVKQVFGQLVHETTEIPYPGVQIHPPSTDTGFWVIHFVPDYFPPDFPRTAQDKYRLEVYDADDEEGEPLRTVPGLTFVPSEKPSDKKPSYDDVSVTYPLSDVPVDSEFAAYGTAPGSIDVTGECTNCDYQIMQGSGGPNWILYCLVSAPDAPVDCGLTVSQTGAGDGYGSFEIPKA